MPYGSSKFVPYILHTRFVIISLMEFKRPKKYIPCFTGQPSPSRNEILKSDLGFDDDDSSCSWNSSDENPEVDQAGKDVTIIELQALQLEIQKKDKQREELLLKYKELADKTANYRSRLNKSEQNKKSQMKIMKKTYELFVEEKDKLIGELQEVLSEHEKALSASQNGRNKKKGKVPTSLPGIERLVNSISELQQEKVKLSELLYASESEVESLKEEMMDRNAKYNTEIADLEIEIKKLKSTSNECEQEDSTTIKRRLASIEKENQVLRVEREEAKSELWKTQEELGEKIRQLESEIRCTNKKKRDAEAKYINLAATPPKVQVRTVQVISEEMKKDLEEQVAQNRTLRDLLEKMKMESDAKLQGLESDHKSMVAQMVEDYESKMVSVKSEMEQSMVKLEKDYELKLNDVKKEIVEVKENCSLEVERISNHRDNELEKMRLDYERTNGGLRKLYVSLQENCVKLSEESKELKLHQQYIKNACHQFNATIAPICTEICKQIMLKVADINTNNVELERRYIKEMKLRKRLHNELVDLKGNIRVYCRVRPFIAEDRVGASSQTSTISFDQSDDGVLLVSNKGSEKKFEMEKVFQPRSTQEEVYAEVQDLVVSCLDGYNICIFAYGQTGSGKTFTMEGPSHNPGINQRALAHLFHTVSERSRDWTYCITVNVLEIYNETIRDLLSENSQKLEMKLGSDGVNYVRGLADYEVKDIEDVNKLFAMGRKNRSTALTNMNEHSSRSHAILRITVSGNHRASGTTITGKLNLVDLAGSERVNKSGSEGLRMKEAQNINKSLSCLGDVIHALKNKQQHVPYRNSRLTFLLQDSLGGDSKTLMVVQVSPAAKNVAETLCSLNFAQRVRMVELGLATKKVENVEQKVSENVLIKARFSANCKVFGEKIHSGVISASL
ncbi:kinesin-like protein KIFC3 isoform X2 [Xenia sp. Carnegie-2017]|uniref:kinesin-like protein KIFC3 isoform X2 n=1 Tax=Xenia sp. Carnegie-2017 TaxID=2897299 RepID=UPI001F040940|nr:kinesin-like protein KIFC3 isoform X2 [Xenia sp. Carnegie-2017]